MKNILIILLVTVGLLGCSQNSKKKDGVPTATLMSKGDNSSTNSAPLPSNTKTLLPEVAEKYEGIVIKVTNKKNNLVIEDIVEFGANNKKAIKDTPLTVEILSMYPHFIMVDGGVANQSMEEKNPASKVRIYKDDILVFEGWLFQNFPDVHTYEDPDFGINMVSPKAK